MAIIKSATQEPLTIGDAKSTLSGISWSKVEVELFVNGDMKSNKTTGLTKDELMKEIDDRSKDELLRKKKDEGYKTSIRKSGEGIEYDSLIFSLSKDETDRLTELGQVERVREIVINAVSHSIMPGVSGDKLTIAQGLHTDTDHVHFQLMVNRYAVDEANKTIGTSEMLHKASPSAALTEIINKSLKEAGIDLSFQSHISASQDMKRDEYEAEEAALDLIGEAGGLGNSQSREALLTMEVDSKELLDHKDILIERQIETQKAIAKLQQEAMAEARSAAILDKAVAAIEQKQKAEAEKAEAEEARAKAELEKAEAEKARDQAFAEVTELTEYKEKADVKLFENEQQIEELTVKVDDQGTIIVDQEKEIMSFESKVDTLVKEIADAKATIEIQDDTIAKATDQIKEGLEKLNATTAELGRVIVERDQSVSALEQVTDELNLVKTDLVAITVERDDFKSKLEEQSKKFDNMMDMFNKSQAQSNETIADMRSQHTEMVLMLKETIAKLEVKVERAVEQQNEQQKDGPSWSVGVVAASEPIARVLAAFEERKSDLSPISKDDVTAPPFAVAMLNEQYLLAREEKGVVVAAGFVEKDGTDMSIEGSAEQVKEISQEIGSHFNALFNALDIEARAQRDEANIGDDVFSRDEPELEPHPENDPENDKDEYLDRGDDHGDRDR